MRTSIYSTKIIIQHLKNYWSEPSIIINKLRIDTNVGT